MIAGNAIVGQSGGPTSVINSSLLGVIETSVACDRISEIYGMRYGLDGLLGEKLIDLGNQDRRVLEGLRSTPSSALGSSRHKLKQEELPVLQRLFEKYNIRYFFMIGGNDTMDTVHRVEEWCKGVGWELYGVGIPKTVDNDLFGTDHTPGFPSAARYNILSTLQAGVLARDMQKVDKFVIYQTIGRDAGWLAAATAVASGGEGDAPHLIYCPEIPFQKDAFLEDAVECVRKYGWVSIVVSEGIRDLEGNPVSATSSTDDFNNPEFGAMGGGSVGLALHRMLMDSTGWRGEFQVIESLNMCAMDRALRTDIEEAYECGCRAVQLASEGDSGVMVTILRKSSNPYQAQYGKVALADVAIRAKTMPREYFNSAGNYVTDSFIDYISPLVGKIPNYVRFPIGGLGDR